MYIKVGMANREKRPKQERDDIHFTHIAISTSFYNTLYRDYMYMLPAQLLASYIPRHYNEGRSGLVSTVYTYLTFKCYVLYMCHVRS